MKCAWYRCHRNTPGQTPTGKVSRARFCSQGCANAYATDKLRRKRKTRAVEYMGGKCETCGYSMCEAALEFHHKDTTDKLFSLSMSMLTIHSWPDIVRELDKCQILCANCRRELKYLEYQNRER